MKIETWPLDRIKPYPRNARKIPQGAIDKVALSLRTFGWRQPMVVESDGTLIVGHVRLLGAKSNGWTEGPVHIATDLSPEQIRAYRLMDNRSHDEARWDWELVGVELGDLSKFSIDLSLTGFDPGQRPEYGNAPEPRPDKVAEFVERYRVATAQTWSVGKHRLYIGTSAEAASACDGVCTDPPFDMDAKQIAAILRSHARTSVVLCADRQFIGLGNILRMELAFVWARRSSRTLPMRSKTTPVLRHAMVGIFTEGKASGWNRPRSDFSSLLECESEFDLKTMGHAKHPEIFRLMLAGFKWQTVCDPFAGSCAVLLACEQSGRMCLSYEIDPKTAAIALDRCERAGLRCSLEPPCGRDIDAIQSTNHPAQPATA